MHLPNPIPVPVATLPQRGSVQGSGPVGFSGGRRSASWFSVLRGRKLMGVTSRGDAATPPSRSRDGRRIATLAFATLALLGSQGLVSAQSEPFAMPWEIDVAHVHHAMTALTVKVDQVRRIVERRGENVVTIGIREHLLRASGQGPGGRFELTFQGLENEKLTESQFAQRDMLFRSQVGAIHLDQSFRVLDLEAARKNYALFFIDSKLRAQRPVYRVVLVPRLIARSIWLLELDMQTGYPLYTGEYNAIGQFAGELEVTAFRHGNDVSLPKEEWGWQVPATVTEFPTPSDAITMLGTPPFVLPQPGTMPPGYEPHAARSIRDPLSTKRRLVLDYSDGIDQIHVIEVPTTEQPFVAGGHTVSLYTDAGLTLAHFRHAGLECTIVGRGTEIVVRYVAENFFRQLLR